MKRTFQPLLAVLAAAIDRQLARYVQFLKEDNQILRGRLSKRLIFTPQEWRRLVKLGPLLGLAVHDLITSVTNPTYLCWVREANQQNQEEGPAGWLDRETACPARTDLDNRP
jgi:putative transposase